MQLERIDGDLYRLLIPFEDLTTTVYLLKTERGAAIVDSATTPYDVDNYIMPALDALGISRKAVRFLLLTHAHGDHAGGIARLSECLPEATVKAPFEHDLQNDAILKNGDLLLDRLQVISLPGHTKNSVGYFDVKTKTLLSGDCLQLKGIGKYRNGIALPRQYIESVKQLQAMEIDRIVAAHEYDPLGSVAQGKAEVSEYLELCIQVANELEKTKKEQIK